MFIVWQKTYSEETQPMPANVKATVTANAPKHAVWKVLADFPNISHYTDSIKSSVSTSEQPFEVGASRRCALAPAGALDEEIIEIVPGERLTISVVKGSGVPIKSSITTFSLAEIDANTTQMNFHAQVEPKGWILSGILAKILERRLPKGAEKTLKDLSAAAERIARDQS
jgi:uncharacterized membrane protein